MTKKVRRNALPFLILLVRRLSLSFPRAGENDFVTNLKRICVEEDSVKHCSFLGSRDGAVVRAIASYQCGLGFESRRRWRVCGSCLLLILFLAPGLFFRVQWEPPPAFH